MYQYLTGSRFRQHMQAIVEAFEADFGELGPLHREAECGRAAHRIADECSPAEFQRGAEIAEVTIARRLRVFERLGLGRAADSGVLARTAAGVSDGG